MKLKEIKKKNVQYHRIKYIIGNIKKYSYSFKFHLHS